MDYSKQQLFDEISEHMTRLRREGKALDGSQLKIGDTNTTIQIDHTAQYWCFIRKGDTAPNSADYFYSGNLITEIFPHLIDEYNVHQRRRELAKEMEALNEFNIDLIENDEGIDLCCRKEYLEDTKGLLQYHLIMPEALFDTPNIEQAVVDELGCKLDQVVKDGKHLQLAVLTIGDHEVILKICNEKLYWWFSFRHHEVPNAEEYFFAHGLLEKLFPELIEGDVEMKE